MVQSPWHLHPAYLCVRPSEAIRGHPRSSEVIRGHQRSSEVIRGHQRSSEAIRGHQRSSEVIRGHQRSSEVIRGHQRSSEVIRGHPRSSEVIRGHQRSSEVIRGHQSGPRRCNQRSSEANNAVIREALARSIRGHPGHPGGHLSSWSQRRFCRWSTIIAGCGNQAHPLGRSVVSSSLSTD